MSTSGGIVRLIAGLLSVCAAFALTANARQPDAAADGAAGAQKDAAGPGIGLSGNDDGLGVSLGIGWSGTLVADRWCPIEVTVASEKSAFEGVVVAQYVQDATQEAAISVPVAAVPGRPGVATVYVNLPANTDRLDITIVSAATGRPVRTITCEAFPGADRVRLPPVFPGVRFVWGVLAERDSVAASIDRLYAPASDAATRGTPDRPAFGERDAVWLAGVRRDAAPAVWAGYDAFDAVVAQDVEIGRLDARAQRALRQWVRSGGRLIVAVTSPDGAGAVWRALGAEGEAPVRISGVREDEPPAALRAGVREQVEVLRDPGRAELGAQTESGAARAPEGTPWEPPELVGTMQAARMTLTAAGESGAWRLVHAEEDGDGEAWAWAAEGPLEFGVVTVVTFDPRRIGARADSGLTACAWRSVLEADAEDMAAQARASSTGAWGYVRTTRSEESSGAMMWAMDALCGVPRLSPAIPLGIGASVAAMALVLGVIDPRMLGRARRPWSFLTALGWIGAAGLASWMVPGVLRGSGSSVGMLRVMDVGPALVGSGSGGADADGGWGYRSRLTSIWAGAGREAPLPRDDDGAWFRGVASTTEVYGQSRVQGRASFVQRAGDISGEEAAGGPDHGWALGGAMLPARVRLAVWTLRSFLDQGRETTEVSAELTAAAGTALVTLRGIGADEEIVAAGVRVEAGWYVARDFTGNARGEATGAPRRVLEASLFWTGEEPSHVIDVGAWPYGENRHRVGTGGRSAQITLGGACRIPGAWERGRAVRLYRESGRYGVVLVMTEAVVSGQNGPGARAGADGAEAREVRVYRLVVPIDEAFVEIGEGAARGAAEAARSEAEAEPLPELDAGQSGGAANEEVPE